MTPITYSSLVFLEKLEVINKLWFINKLLMVKTKTETFNLLILFMEFLIWWGLNNMKLGNRLYIYRSSHPGLFLRKGVLKICSKFTESHAEVWFAKQSNCIEITLRHGCSLVNLLHIFRTPFPRNTSGWLLLYLRRLLFWTMIEHRMYLSSKMRVTDKFLTKPEKMVNTKKETILTLESLEFIH